LRLEARSLQRATTAKSSLRSCCKHSNYIWPLGILGFHWIFIGLLGCPHMTTISFCPSISPQSGFHGHPRRIDIVRYDFNIPTGGMYTTLCIASACTPHGHFTLNSWSVATLNSWSEATPCRMATLLLPLNS
jgi:hypothetical protein